MKKVMGILLVSTFLYGCQATPKIQRLTMPSTSLDKGDEFLCISGNNSYFLAKNKVLKSDVNGKEHDQMGIIVGVNKEIMKDNSINYEIRFAIRKLFADGVVPEYSYYIDYISFNSETVDDGFMSSGVYLTHMISFPSIPDLKILNLKRKSFCKTQPNGYELMTNAEINMNFNDSEQY